LLIVLEKLVSTENISDENKRRGFKKNWLYIHVYFFNSTWKRIWNVAC
jgi:hypothetical protein